MADFKNLDSDIEEYDLDQSKILLFLPSKNVNFLLHFLTSQRPKSMQSMPK